MIKKLFQLLKYTLLLCILVFLLFVFLPKKYEVPQIQKRKSTAFWNLPTGSKIAYTLVPAKSIKQPYPIIYLQGGPGGFISTSNIKQFEPLSSDGYDIYLYDQIGSGQSERLDDINNYTADRHKKDLEEIIQKIGAEKVILIGQSWGAILATLFLADHPEKVYQVIFTGAGPIHPVRQELLKINPPDSLHLQKPLYSNKEANEQSKSIRTSMVSFFAQSFGIKLASDQEMDDFQTFRNHKLNKATVCDTINALKAEGGGGFYAQMMTLRSLKEIKDPRSKLKGFTIPVLLMKGQCDNQPWGFTTEYLALFPNIQLKIIPNAGHSIQVEQSEVYLKTIREFLNINKFD